MISNNQNLDIEKYIFELSNEVYYFFFHIYLIILFLMICYQLII